MDLTAILLRLTHVFFGVFWAGTIFFMATFLLPSVRRAGPDGGKVMYQLVRSRFVVLLPAFALLNIFSGIWLLARTSGGWDPGWMGSRPGIVLSTGGALAIVAFLIGMTVQRPASMKIAALAEEIQAGGGPPSAEQSARMAALQKRVTTSLHWIAALIAIAVMCMAVFRYV